MIKRIMFINNINNVCTLLHLKDKKINLNYHKTKNKIIKNNKYYDKIKYNGSLK